MRITTWVLFLAAALCCFGPAVQVPGRVQLRRLQLTYFNRPAGRASDGRLVIDFVVQAMELPLLSPYLQPVGSDNRHGPHGANFATLASTVLLPNTSLFVTGTSPFPLGIQLNQTKEFRNKVLTAQLQWQQ